MLKRNIPKIALFVISAFLFILGGGCDGTTRSSRRGVSDASRSENFEPPTIVGRIASDRLTELSGLAASKCQPGIFWAHNDSGDAAILFAIDLSGKTLGVFQIENAKNVDWEDIADAKDEAGKCVVYIGDIGNNGLEREMLQIYVVPEPPVDAASQVTDETTPAEINASGRIEFSYTDGVRRDAETLMATPNGDALYIVGKTKAGPASVFKIVPGSETDSAQAAKKVGEIAVPAVPEGFITGGDISPDGRSLVLCDYFAGYELSLPATAKAFDEIWMAKPKAFAIGDREIGEAIAFTADGAAVIASSEKKHPPLYQAQRRMNGN